MCSLLLIFIRAYKVVWYCLKLIIMCLLLRAYAWGSLLHHFYNNKTNIDDIFRLDNISQIFLIYMDEKPWNIVRVKLLQ